MITVQKMRLYGLGIAFACFAWVGATAQTPYGWRGPERSGTYLSGNGFAERMARRRP